MKTLEDTVIFKKQKVDLQRITICFLWKRVSQSRHLTGIFQYSLKIHWHEIHTKHNYIRQLVAGFLGKGEVAEK